MVEIKKQTGYTRKVQASQFEPVDVHENVTLVFTDGESEEEIEERVEEEFWKCRSNVERRLAEILVDLKRDE